MLIQKNMIATKKKETSDKDEEITKLKDAAGDMKINLKESKEQDKKSVSNIQELKVVINDLKSELKALSDNEIERHDASTCSMQENEKGSEEDDEDEKKANYKDEDKNAETDANSDHAFECHAQGIIKATDNASKKCRLERDKLKKNASKDQSSAQ